METDERLSAEIAEAARAAFRDLFKNHPGSYYYCSLITTGEAHAPVLAAWSHQALEKAVTEAGGDENLRTDLKWSYADSPYYCHGEEYFDKVNAMFEARPRLVPGMETAEWDKEYQVRLKAMEEAMAQLISEGIFGTGKKRMGCVVLVEVMPPDYTNTERALRLNPVEALREWLDEAAEEV